MGMPPSVAGVRLATAPPQAMKKRASHRPLERFPTNCCAKNTQFGRTRATVPRRALYENSTLLSVTCLSSQAQNKDFSRQNREDRALRTTNKRIFAAARPLLPAAYGYLVKV